MYAFGASNRPCLKKRIETKVKPVRKKGVKSGANDYILQIGILPKNEYNFLLMH